MSAARATAPRRVRRVALIAGVSIAALTIGGVIAAMVGPSQPHTAQPHTARPTAATERQLTTEESERLAVTRFLNYEGGSIDVDTAFDTPDGRIELHGVVDYRAHVGTAAATVGGTPMIVQWDADTVLTWTGVGDGASMPTAVPAEPAAARPLSPSSATLDTILAVLGGLGADRPENAQLLQQSGARWLAADDIDGAPMDVIAGPGSPESGAGAGTTRYWIDDDGRLHRFEADLPGQSVTIDMHSPAVASPIEPSPQLDSADG